jgi:hypothetical protein
MRWCPSPTKHSGARAASAVGLKCPHQPQGWAAEILHLIDQDMRVWLKIPCSTESRLMNGTIEGEQVALVQAALEHRR